MEKITSSSQNLLNAFKNISLSRQILNVIFVPAIILITVISIFSYFQVNNLIKANHWVSHTYEVIQATDTVLYDAIDIESHQRGFLITGQREFLDEIIELQNNLTRSQTSLLKLVSDNLDQYQRALKLGLTIKRRLNYLYQNIELKKKNIFNTNEGIDLFLRGQNDSDEVKAIGKEIKSIEITLLSERNATAIDVAKNTNEILIISSAFSTLFLLLAFYFIKHELNTRDRVEKNKQIAETRLRSIIENANDMIAALDKELRFIIFNEAYKKEFKRLFHKNIAINMSLEEALSEAPDAKDKLLTSWQLSVSGEEYTKTLELFPNGEKNTYEVTSSLIEDNGEITGAVHIIRNITHRIKEQTELQKSYEQLHTSMLELQEKNREINSLVEMSDMMLASNSQEELSLIMSRYCEIMLDFTSGILYIMHPSRNYLEKSSKWRIPQEQDITLTAEQCWAIRLGRVYKVTHPEEQLICPHIKNIQNDLTYHCIPLMAQNDIYGLLYLEIKNNNQSLTENQQLLVTAFAELTALGLANARLRDNLRYQSMRDPLTGLYNRRYLEDFLFKQIHEANRRDVGLAILMLDIDHFKKINDNYGHDAGDEVLKKVGALLREDLNVGDIAARYGGEEFILVYYDADALSAKIRAENLRKAVTQIEVKYGAQQLLPINISVGISEYPKDGKNANELITAADQALYHAKQTGRNKTVLSSEI